jgi:hypothetical protein
MNQRQGTNSLSGTADISPPLAFTSSLISLKIFYGTHLDCVLPGKRRSSVFTQSNLTKRRILMPLTTANHTMSRTASACAIALAVLVANGAAFAATPTPNTHSTTMTPAAQLAVKGAITMQAPTLSAIHQVLYTEQGVETWIKV